MEFNPEDIGAIDNLGDLSRSCQRCPAAQHRRIVLKLALMEALEQYWQANRQLTASQGLSVPPTAGSSLDQLAECWQNVDVIREAEAATDLDGLRQEYARVLRRVGWIVLRLKELTITTKLCSGYDNDGARLPRDWYDDHRCPSAVLLRAQRDRDANPSKEVIDTNNKK